MMWDFLFYAKINDIEKGTQMIKVFTTGTFDILHYGHINFLKRANALGDYLIVGVNVNPEGKTPYYSYEERKLILESITYVDEVVPLYSQEDKYQYLEKADIFACGEEYRNHFDIPRIEKYTPVVFISRTPGISTTQLKSVVKHDYEFNTIVVDVDDTISFTEDRKFDESKPNIEVINKINELYDKGWNIIIFTARGAKSCKTIQERIDKYDKVTRDWLDKNNVHYTDVVFGKPNADFYVDDKNMSIDDFLNFRG